MGRKKYSNIDRAKLIAGLNKLDREIPELSIESSSKHTIKLSFPGSVQPYPVPIGHRKLSARVVEGVVNWLVKCGACGEERFDEIMKIK